MAPSSDPTPPEAPIVHASTQSVESHPFFLEEEVTSYFDHLEEILGHPLEEVIFVTDEFAEVRAIMQPLVCLSYD